MTNGLIAHYPMHGDAGDVSGHGMHGRILGSPKMTTNRFGEPGYACAFSGGMDAMVLTNLNVNLATNSQNTVCLWLRWNGGVEGNTNHVAMPFGWGNTNQNYCGVTSTSRGADLNRNFAFQWGCCGGSSGAPCDLTYRGPSPASEPEVQAVQTYMRSIFPDQRADPLTAVAPVDATGIYVDLHSYSELVLWPWGFTSTVPPNPAPPRPGTAGAARSSRAA